MNVQSTEEKKTLLRVYTSLRFDIFAIDLQYMKILFLPFEMHSRKKKKECQLAAWRRTFSLMQLLHVPPKCRHYEETMRNTRRMAK